MDGLTLFGFILGFLAIACGQFIEGGHLSSLFNFPALVIVLGGTFAAVLVQTQMKVLKRASMMFKWVFYPPQYRYKEIIDTVVRWSKMARQHGLLSIEKEIPNLRDPVLIKGAELMVSGMTKEIIINSIEADIDSSEIKDLNAIKVFESMGGYSPTLGILGAVLGLIHVMQNLSEPEQLGLGIAVAFVATVYGVGFANLIFLPVANKLKYIVFQRIRLYEMYLVGITSLIGGDSPRLIELKMSGFADIRYRRR